MNQDHNQLIACGIYTVAEASRLVKVSPGRIRRWVKGRTPPLVEGLKAIDGVIGLSFLDLMEVRILAAFRQQGVSWTVLRLAHLRACTELHTKHPFATRRFATDGRKILYPIGEEFGDIPLLDIVSGQSGFRAIISPFLKDIDFDVRTDQACRWWPMGKKRPVVLDPQRAFGQPIVNEEAVPTKILFKAFRVERSVREVAAWYRVRESSVEAAVEFEQKLAA